MSVTLTDRTAKALWAALLRPTQALLMDENDWDRLHRELHRQLGKPKRKAKP